MSDRSPLRTMSIEEYFRFEEISPIRHEYVAGEIYAMTGGTARHGRIVRNIATRLDAAAGDGPCEVFIEGMRVAAANDTYYYSDVMVTCSPLGDLEVVAREPRVVVEVTSPRACRSRRETDGVSQSRDGPRLLDRRPPTAPSRAPLAQFQERRMAA